MFKAKTFSHTIPKILNRFNVDILMYHHDSHVTKTDRPEYLQLSQCLTSRIFMYFSDIKGNLEVSESACLSSNQPL